MRRNGAELIDAAGRALDELRRIEEALERAAADTPDKQTAGRIRDAAVRVEAVRVSLARELDMARPSRAMLRRILKWGSTALGLLGMLVYDDISDRVDTFDVFGDAIAPVFELISGDSGAAIAQAAAGYFVEVERFEAVARTVGASVTFEGTGSLHVGEPEVIDGGTAAGDDFAGAPIDGGSASSRYPGYRDGYGPVDGGGAPDAEISSQGIETEDSTDHLLLEGGGRLLFEDGTPVRLVGNSDPVLRDQDGEALLDQDGEALLDHRAPEEN